MNYSFNYSLWLNLILGLILMFIIIKLKLFPKFFQTIIPCLMGLLIIKFMHKLGDLELIRLLCKLNIKDLIKLCSMRFRFTSSKSLPNLKHLNIKAMLHATYVRFIMKLVSPVKHYLMYIKTIWECLMKLGSMQTFEIYA